MTMAKHVKVLSLLDDLQACRTSQQVIDTFSDYVREFGFTSVAVSQFANPARIPLSRRIALVTWPEEYQNLRMDDQDEVHDPIISYALRSRKPFLWREAYEHADRYGKAMMDRAKEFNLTDGIVFPIHTADGLPGGVSLTGDTSDLSETDRAELYLASIHCYGHLEKILGPFPFAVHVTLSRREKDVLHWAAAGKTTWEISSILSLSQKTIEHYAQSARRKLSAVNMTHAVSNAIALELIMP
jgi:LuxR family transcriptional regulator, quorum-sensing system regulator BjaR1